MTWNKQHITLDDGRIVEAIAPEIVSASRSTDIPAFYSDWFFHRLKVGYSAWINPFNGVKSYVSYSNTRFIVFWSKDPKPLLNHLEYLREREIGCYIQYTLNDYESESLEKGVPPLQERIETFKKLVEKLGFGGVVWRFDPLILTDKIDIEKLLTKIENIGDKLKGYTEKLVFSFADIDSYRRVKFNLEKNGILYKEWTKEEMSEFDCRLVELNKKKGWNYELSTCAEHIDLKDVSHNQCVDDSLIIRRAYHDKVLINFLKSKIYPIPEPNIFGEREPLPNNAILLPNGMYATKGNNRDKGQRKFCGCIRSKDIGQYNTCPHLCEYCYANTSKDNAILNYKKHNLNPELETIIVE